MTKDHDQNRAQRNEEARQRVRALDVAKRLKDGEPVTVDEFGDVAAMDAKDLFRDDLASAVTRYNAPADTQLAILAAASTILGYVASLHTVQFRKRQELEDRIVALEARAQALEASKTDRRN